MALKPFNNLNIKHFFSVLRQGNKHTSLLQEDPNLWALERDFLNKGDWMVSRDFSSIKIALGFALDFFFSGTLSTNHPDPLHTCTHFLTNIAHTKLSELALQIGHCDQTEYWTIIRNRLLLPLSVEGLQREKITEPHYLVLFPHCVYVPST